jgi:hypothetical protein
VSEEGASPFEHAKLPSHDSSMQTAVCYSPDVSLASNCSLSLISCDEYVDALSYTL